MPAPEWIGDFLPDPPQQRLTLPVVRRNPHELSRCPRCWVFDIAFFVAPEKWRVRWTVGVVRHVHRQRV